MSAQVAVVGASGRVGRALVEYLSAGWLVQALDRRPDEAADDLAERIAPGVRVIVNAAGVAHIERPTADDLERLRLGNVVLPLAIGRAALRLGASLVHISSVKATDPGSSLYARSKRDGDDALADELAGSFDEEGLALVVVRPLAMLFPPLDAGRVKLLRWVRWVPAWATPPLPLPVLAPDTFLHRVGELVGSSVPRAAVPGFRVAEFADADRGTLRDARMAMVRWQEERST